MTVSLDRYEIKELLGQGAMAEVFRAYDRHIHREVAIKLLRKDRSVDTYFRQRLVREARAVAQLPHPNIVTVFDAGESENRPYIVMELLEGRFLDEWLKINRTCAWQDVLIIATQLASALNQAHDKGIIHRDIKPANIIWQEDKQTAKLADFGIAHIETANTAFTQAGQLIGTPQYMAPEQIQGKQADARSDLFSLGVVLYHLLTGNRPFNGESLASLAYQITHAQPPPIDTTAVKAPKYLVRIINKLLTKSPKQRYQSAADLLADIKAVGGKKTVIKKSQPVLTTLSVAAGLLVCGSLVWYLWPGSPPPPPPPPPQPTIKLLSPDRRQIIEDSINQKIKQAFTDTNRSCSRVTVSLSNDGQASLTGYVGSEEYWGQVSELVESTPGVLNTIYEKLLTLPWPTCEAASIIAPYQASGLKVQLSNKPFRNEPLVLDVTTPGYEAFVYIDVFHENGTVIHLLQKAKRKPGITWPYNSSPWRLPDADGAGLILVLASAEPILNSGRKRTESAGNYLSYLHGALSKRRKHVAAEFVSLKPGQRL